jgi:hypothetical protein
MQDYERVKDLVNALGLTPRSFAENVDARFTIFAVHSPQESVSEMVRVSVCVFVCSLFSLTDLLTHPHTIPTFTHLHTPPTGPVEPRRRFLQGPRVRRGRGQLRHGRGWRGEGAGSRP